jgi:hypothetical protein
MPRELKKKYKGDKKDALKETLKALEGFLECKNKNKNKYDKCCEDSAVSCSFSEKDEKKKHCKCDCAKCVIASRKACDAPVLKKLLNTVYTVIPNFKHNCPIVVCPDIITTLPDINYYVQLPCDECNEVRVLWPMVWIIRELIKKLRVTGTGFINVKFILNILTKKLAVDPAQLQPTLNVGGATNGPCICDTIGAVQYNYEFFLNYAATSSSLCINAPSTFTGGTVTFSVPNNEEFVTYSIAVPEGNGDITILLPDPLVPALIEAGVLTDPAIDPNTFGARTAFSPAHFISFIHSCDKDKCCDGYWVATMLNTDIGDI